MRRRIAILGGGASALFAAWDLVHTDPGAYDITVYQLGWRLGGKGASGRRTSAADNRIEEHGLHFMFGFYENVFRVVREAYAEHYGDPQLWQAFFKTDGSSITMAHFPDPPSNNWEAWNLISPKNGSLPGEPGGDITCTVGTILEAIWAWLGALAQPGASPSKAHANGGPADDLRRRIDQVLHHPPPSGEPPPQYWELARQFLEALAPNVPDEANRADDAARFDKLTQYTALVIGRSTASTEEILALVVYMTAVVRGLTADLFLRGSSNWFELDQDDLRTWLGRHGGDPASPLVAGIYDAVFASYSQLGAGSILQSSLKGLFCFKGGPIFKMSAGMGDTIFTPLYLALKERGVKFRFFHRVENLGLSPDGQFVQTIDMEQQIVFKGDYDPLVDVGVTLGGLPSLACWPNEPVWDRLPPAEVNRVRGKIDLENYWTPRAPADRMVTLTRGKHFDDVILGISVAALPDICADLLLQDARFNDHVTVLAQATTATQAMQLWTVTDPAQPEPLIAPFVEPYDTVADMNQLLPAETWPPETVVGIRYLCSPIPEPSPPPGRDQTGYPGALRDFAKRNGLAWLTTWAPSLWTNLVSKGAFDWSALYDPSGRSGGGRLDAQYVHTPTNLSDRYVIATPTSNGYRLMANGTQFLNLYITGDWIKTSLSIGCLEAAAMGGIQAARALSLERGTAEVPRARGDWIDDVKPRAQPAARRRRARHSSAASYRRRDGEFISPPPYQANMSDLFLFFLQADAAQLQKVCDNELNLGPTSYAPLGNFVVLYGARIDDLTMGITCHTQEAGIWIPVLADDGSLKTYSPYVWIDSSTSTVVGRGVQGYTKLTSEVVLPQAGQLFVISAACDALLQSGTGLCVERSPLVTVGSDALWTPPDVGGLTRWPALATLVAQAVLALNAIDEPPTLSELVSLLGGMKSVFLKQFPGAAGSDPSYQALVEATISPVLSTVAGTTLDRNYGNWTITMPSYREPCIVDRLGLTATLTIGPDLSQVYSIVPQGQVWMQFQGSIGPGTELWRAGG